MQTTKLRQKETKKVRKFVINVFILNLHWKYIGVFTRKQILGPIFGQSICNPVYISLNILSLIIFINMFSVLSLFSIVNFPNLECNSLSSSFATGKFRIQIFTEYYFLIYFSRNLFKTTVC